MIHHRTCIRLTRSTNRSLLNEVNEVSPDYMNHQVERSVTCIHCLYRFVPGANYQEIVNDLIMRTWEK
ncbi:hypothetical protein T08_6953 [Trichinella sp. T8]|uniref:Uncharacterized protein n=1 Tax=Trichinella murrelli TaxID=144512 RepID=A0A0V0T5R8_9BILA|nr:hypothetical protein T05_14219 [Trichinella murrelli]KRZ93361.1 hypothetical protein T08_6953 [Trichinella sp. T8]